MNDLEKLKNLEEIQKTVDELKEKIINLKEEVKIDELESKEDNKYKRERKRIKERYYWVDYLGIAWEVLELNNDTDDFLYSIGNYFETEEQAENYKERLLIEQELKDIAMELNKGKKINWIDKMQWKYCLYYDFTIDKIKFYYSLRCREQGAIYCLDKNFKDTAIERIGEERLTKYLKGELD